MTKKKDEEEVDTTTEVKGITPISHDYLRQDLNDLRDKVNEIVSFLNK